MIAAGRNLLVVFAVFIAVFLVCAVSQEGFSLLFPALSHRFAFNVDLATYFVLMLSALLYFVFGLLVPRWIRGPWPLVWLLLPVVSVYALAVAYPYPFRCTPFIVEGCWMIQAIFVVPAAAIVTGYMFYRASRQRGRNVV